MLPFITALNDLDELVTKQEEKIGVIINIAKIDGRYPTRSECSDAMRKMFAINCEHDQYGQCIVKVPFYTNPKGIKSYGGICELLEPAGQLIFTRYNFTLEWSTLKEMMEEVKHGGMWRKCEFIGHEQTKRSWVLADIPCSPKNF